MGCNRLIAVTLLVTLASCSVITNKQVEQCQTDEDCLKFGGHPYCQNGVCVPSGLGPENCFTGTPGRQDEYLNACSTTKFLTFDNCARLGLCGSAKLPAPIEPVNAKIPPPVNPSPAPLVKCADAGPNIIYMYGAADFGPLLKAVQPLLSASTPAYRGVFQNASSCAGVASIFDPAKRLMKDPAPGPSAGWAFYFDDAGNQVNCNLAVEGNTVDIGVSDLFASTCDKAWAPGNAVADYIGPVVPFAWSVPALSTEKSISAEAAHLIFGLGGRSGGAPGIKDAVPWTDPNYYFIRAGSAASTVLTSLMINVDKLKFWGVDRLSTDNLRDSMLASTAASQSIGILSMDYADKNRGNLRSLYIQAPGQLAGYLPDSSPTSFDKLPVRDGHYPLWGYVHFFTPITAGGVPSPAAQALVLRFTVPRLEQRLIDEITSASEIPQCAMKVARTAEMGTFSPATGLQCGCYFDFKTTGKASCQPCKTASDCSPSRPACNYGFCELN